MNVLNNVHGIFECALSHARATAPPMMVRSVQVPASNSVLLPQVARLFRIFSLMFIDELNSTTSPEPGSGLER